MLDEARLSHLVSAYFDQQLGAEEMRELEAMLLGSARAREFLIERGEWHGLLREWALRGQAEDIMGSDARVAVPVSGPFRWKLWLPPALAACLALAWFIHVPRPAGDPESVSQLPKPEEDEVALLAQAVDVEWETGSTAYRVGSALPKGWLKLRRGTLRLDFYSGARVFLEGPASFDLLSQNLARLERGKLTAQVPPPAAGFSILNANLRVVDRGTEFGMNVSSPNDCEVHVFDGEVELQGDVPALHGRSLVQGKGISIRQGVWENILADRRSFVDPGAVLKAADSETKELWQSWRADSEAFRRTPDLLVYFDFETPEPGGQLLRNRAAGASNTGDGSIIGCEPGVGRWAGKSALCFAKTSDRIRFRTEGSTPSLTMMAWVRVDSLPIDHNALFSMAPSQVGEIHWKIDKSGRLVLGLRAENKRTFAAWERLESPCIVSVKDFGRWMFLATVIDGAEGVMKHYVNGAEVASASMKRRPQIRLGMANIGNFDAAQPSSEPGTVARYFNGRIDEFALVRRAMTAGEIGALK